jgi:uncharacterized protein
VTHSYQVSEKKIKDLVAVIVEGFDPERIILFGSWAWGSPGPDSDVDVLVIKKTNNSRQLARQIDGSLFPRLFPLDILVYNPDQLEERTRSGDFFVKDILDNGKVLYDKST